MILELMMMMKTNTRVVPIVNIIIMYIILKSFAGIKYFSHGSFFLLFVLNFILFFSIFFLFMIILNFFIPDFKFFSPFSCHLFHQFYSISIYLIKEILSQSFFLLPFWNFYLENETELREKCVAV